MLQSLGVGWCEGVAAGALGDPYARMRRIVKPTAVWLRHTVGLADRLLAQDPGADPDDGLPATLSDAIAHYGLRRFKLKLCGRIDEDIERLLRIAELLDRQAGDYHATLDGNESFADSRHWPNSGAAWSQRRDCNRCVDGCCCSNSRCRAQSHCRRRSRRWGSTCR